MVFSFNQNGSPHNIPSLNELHLCFEIFEKQQLFCWILTVKHITNCKDTLHWNEIVLQYKSWYVEQTYAWHASLLKMWAVYKSKRQLAHVPKTCLVYSTNSHFWSIKVAGIVSYFSIVWKLYTPVTLSNIIWKV